MSADLLSALTWAFGAFALCNAVFNLWIFSMRPRDAAHLWLAVMSLGVVVLSSSWAASYQATTVAAAHAWVEQAMIGAIPFAAGVVRFSELFAGIRHAALRAAVAYLAIGVGLFLAVPELHFTGNAIELHAIGGLTYLIPEVTTAAALFFTPFVAAIGYIAHAYVRRAHEIEGGRAISRAVVAFGLCMAHDLGVLLGTHWAPSLSPLGFALFAGTFGSLLLDRLVRSQLHLERSASELHAIVDARTAELRRKDLELAHGARLATLGALAGGIAMEIERPLAEIAGHVKTLRDASQAPASNGSLRESLAEAQRGVERICVVVAELLGLARREEGATGRHDLSEIVAQVLPVASYELSRRARLRTSLARSPQVLGDSAMLAQIALHLIVGAIQSTPKLGDAHEAVITIETGDHAGRAFLAVTDTGAPLAASAAAEFFDPRSRDADDTHRASYAVTRQLVERHGGTLKIESTHAGNRLVVELPAAAPEEAQ